MPPSPWLVCQIGAREHYSIARALHARGVLAGLITDFWVPPGHGFSRLPGARRLRDRCHPALLEAPVSAPNLRMLGFELCQRITKRGGWPVMMARNRLFQRMAIQRLASLTPVPLHLAPVAIHGTSRQPVPTVFSYSYAARDLFRCAKERGWHTVLGQIDPGPEEERIVGEEHRRYSKLTSSWQPAPPAYWQSWREELELADRILVNSEWSRECLLKEGVPEDKLEVVPLVYEEKTQDLRTEDRRQERQATGGRGQEERIASSDIQHSRALRVLFLGQINLRKGIGRLLDAMRLLIDEPIELTLAGPTEIDPVAWADLPNVRWVGPVPRSEVGVFYQNADWFILPTLSDGYALTQLEALSFGLPVMASRSCGMAVDHGKNGWILDGLEPETIAAALRHACTAPRLEHNTSPRFSLEDLADVLIQR